MTSALQHVTVLGPFGPRQLDLPADVPVAVLLPNLLAMTGLSNTSPESTGGGWQLTDAVGTLIPEGDTLADYVRSPGATIQLHRVAPAPVQAPPGCDIARNVMVAEPLTAGDDGLSPLQRTTAVLPRPVSKVRLASVAISAFVRGPAGLPQPGASQPSGMTSQHVGRHRLLPSELTVAAPPSRRECAVTAYRDLKYISQLDARIIGPRLKNCATIAVVSPKGGVGKTTVTALLGTLFSMLRRDPIVAVDTNPDFGSLGRILTPDQSWYVDDLAKLISSDGTLSLTALDSRLGRAVHGLLVVPAPTDPNRMAALDQDAYQRLITRLKDFFSLIMLDCGTGLQDPASLAAIETAHQVLLLTDAQPSTASLVAESAELLRQWDRPITVVVNRMPSRGSRLDLDQLSRHIPSARGLVVIPDDVPAASRLASGNFHWRDAPTSWQQALRELAVVLVSDWARLRLSRG
jgi:MinD-like ATPase involved in chromosome partitioning or flagellar assembly